jgi:hypothetical protein
VYREGKIITPFLEGRLPPAQVEGEVMSEGKERLIHQQLRPQPFFVSAVTCPMQNFDYCGLFRM